MPQLRMDCEARWPGHTHDHSCFLHKDHGGRHSCFCGLDWDEDGRVKLRKAPRRR